MSDDIDDDDDVTVSAELRNAAHAALDTWLNGCEVEGSRTFARGMHGPVGTLTLRASVDDAGITLRAERVFEEEL